VIFLELLQRWQKRTYITSPIVLFAMLNKISRLLAATVLLFASHTCYSQLNADSLRSVISSMPDDTASISKIIEMGTKVSEVDFSIALDIYKLAEKKYGEKKNDSLKGVIYTNIGHATSWLGNSSESIRYYLKTKQIGELLGKNIFIATGYSGMAAVYHNNKDYKTAIHFYEEASKYYTNNYSESQKYESTNISNMGYAYYQISQMIDTTLTTNVTYYNSILARGIACNKRALEILKKPSAEYVCYAKSTINLCLEYTALNNIDSAMYFYDYTTSLLPNIEDLDIYCEHAYNKGKLFCLKNDYSSAITAFKESLAFATKQKYQEYIYENYFSLYQCYQKSGNYKDAINYYAKFTATKDSVLNTGGIVEATELKNMYEGQIKEYEIASLTAANKQKSTLNKILLITALALAFIGFLVYLNFIGRQKLQVAKISELEKDKQLHTIDAMLKGQEDERSRIAKDLHDGLGGMLSGVKFSLADMKENMVMDARSVNAFENSILRLDNTIAELRKVAHNLMPEALVKFGLKNAILDYCNSIQISSKTKIIFEQMGAERQLDNTADLYIYRIVQELINNAVKHAAPSQIFVQLTKTLHKVLLTVEDDGKGFNREILPSAKGIGMRSIKQRINYFKGKVDIASHPGQGTSINIELIA
jgi:two-component system, NarL family, sensor kinase